MLAGVDRILAEDTRRTRKLLAHLGLRIPLESYHEYNEQERTPAVVARLEEGESAALVSDAGMPGVSDPGFRLVRAAAAAGVRVVPVPGASAPVTALVASGLPVDRYLFAGYPPRKRRARRELLRELAAVPATLILFESPRRLPDTLADAVSVLGGERPGAVARELTKAHEEIRRGTLDELARRFSTPPRGEITLCIAPAPEQETEAPGAEELRRRHRELVASGVDHKEALRILARQLGLRRRDVYEAVLLSGPDADSDDEES